ncbi:hypothetical protein [Stakelama marina]|uniref:Uncharacterized protein n=1 Tax=Stakelama marina TaxID=2826939 RepID=A0A8T4IFB8_9SPHN|nr:hypothetical protein [Stakelama marina]MBR0551745.1 hypothetical protein [Stakelama marina]
MEMKNPHASGAGVSVVHLAANTESLSASLSPAQLGGLGLYPVQLPDIRALDCAIEALIELRNALDGDPDLEETDAEDAHDLSPMARRYADRGAGCPISDPDCAVDDRPCDPLQEDGV